MNNLFQRASSHWVRYSEYEIKTAADGTKYIKPAPKAKPTVYDPLKGAETLVVDALNVGMLQMGGAAEKVVGAAVMEFVHKYGLLGFVTALPTTPDFMNYDAAYLPKNHFIRDETMPTQDYLSVFFPFKYPDFSKDRRTARWNVSGDAEMMALAAAFEQDSMAMAMSLQRDYAERYDWLLAQFKDWAFIFTTSFLYYSDYDSVDEVTRDLYRQGMAAFSGIAPTYRIALHCAKSPSYCGTSTPFRWAYR